MEWILIKGDNTSSEPTLIDFSFQDKNRLFVSSFTNGDDKRSHRGYFLPAVEMKDYNVMIDGRHFFILVKIPEKLLIFKVTGMQLVAYLIIQISKEIVSCLQ